MAQLDFITIDSKLSVSKYKQIVRSTINAIDRGLLKEGDKMPSINEVCRKFSLSRDTVLMAYNELKSKGILTANPGKAYYIASTDVTFEQNIMLLWDELNGFKEDLYNSFMSTIDHYASVDLHFHYFNRKVFSTLLQENNYKYTSFVIMPALFTGIKEELSRLNGKVYILDQLPLELTGAYPAIYQNFEKQVYDGLMKAYVSITKYKKIISVYPGGKEPDSQLRGFLHFCKDTGMQFEVISDMKSRTVKAGEAYLVVNDSDLVEIIKQSNAQHLQLGSNLGVVSLNDTQLKEVVGNGITTISTDFKEMGKRIGELIISKSNMQIENPFYLIQRGSL